VHLVAEVGVLAKQADGDLGDDLSVGGVDAPFGERRSVRLLPSVHDVYVLYSEAGHAIELAGRRVDHHGGVHAIETPPLHHQDLPSATFFGRGAQHLQSDAEIVGDRRQRPAGPDGRRSDDVVAAGVPDAR
jgi:hypothetical protein